jgi:hypothetical protein
MSNIIEYEFGQRVRLSAYFENAAGVPANPTTVTFSRAVQLVSPPPDPTASNHVFGSDPDVVQDAVGRYHYDFTPAEAGNYIVRVTGTGTVAAVSVSRFRVKPSPFA